MNTFEEFSTQLREERNRGFFQQEGATCHTFRVSLQRVHDVFSEEQRLAKICGRHVPLTLQHATIFSGDIEKYGMRIKSAHDTGTEGQRPRSCSHQNHYVTSGIPKHDQTCAAVYWCRRHPLSTSSKMVHPFSNWVTYLLNYLLTSWSRVLLEKLTSKLCR